MFIHTDRKGYVYEVESYRVREERDGRTVSVVKKRNQIIGKMKDGVFVPNEFYRRREAERQSAQNSNLGVDKTRLSVKN